MKLLGALRARDRGGPAPLDQVFALLPILAERRQQKAGMLSGGQQQTVAIGRALMAAPRCLMLDEPTLGLAPIMVDTLADTIVALYKSGLTILLVEQRVDLALRLADRGYVMETGRIVLEDNADALLADERVKEPIWVHDPLSAALPHYLTLDDGQMRIWRAGTGPSLVVLPGLAMGAAVTVSRLAARFEGWSITAIELPGALLTGDTLTLESMAERIAAALKLLGLEGSVLVAVDMAVPLAASVARHAAPIATILVGAGRARAWARRTPVLGPLSARGDGTHLTALFAHLRDLDELEPSDRMRPARHGDRYLDSDERHATFIAWAGDPMAYTRMWRLCATKIAREDDDAPDATVAACAGVDELAPILAPLRDRAPPAPPVPATRPSDHGIWCDYADIADGRVHLRRAGEGRPLLVFQPAPGSAAPLCGLIESLAASRQVIAPDYLGNGDSAKPRRTVDIARLAGDALQLADRLGLPSFDLWGTHTGALVALELALLAPDRAGRLILEAPPLLPADFSQDILANYLPPLVPDNWGLHVQQAWNMRRDMFLFWPWYRQQRDAVRPLGLPDDAMLHDWTVGLLKSGSTYDLSCRAAFEYDTAGRLPLLTRPALICAGPADMLADGLDRVARIAPPLVSVASTPATVWYPNQASKAIAETIAIYAGYLASE